MLIICLSSLFVGPFPSEFSGDPVLKIGDHMLPTSCEDSVVPFPLKWRS